MVTTASSGQLLDLLNRTDISGHFCLFLTCYVMFLKRKWLTCPSLPQQSSTMPAKTWTSLWTNLLSKLDLRRMLTLRMTVYQRHSLIPLPIITLVFSMFHTHMCLVAQSVKRLEPSSCHQENKLVKHSFLMSITFEFNCGIIFTCVYQPDCSSDPQRQPPLSGVYELYCEMLTGAGGEMCM